MTAKRLLVWCILPLALVTIGLWWNERPQKTAATDTRPPAVVMPADTIPTPASTADIDTLWERYEEMNESSIEQPSSSSAPPTTPSSIATDDDTSPVPSAAARQQQHQAARENIKQRRAAILSARDEALSQIDSLNSDDISGLMETVRRFNTRLRDSDVEAQIDIEAVHHRLQNSQKLTQISQALLQEARKGEAADPERLRSLRQELSNLQTALMDNTSGPSVSKGAAP